MTAELDLGEFFEKADAARQDLLKPPLYRLLDALESQRVAIQRAIGKPIGEDRSAWAIRALCDEVGNLHQHLDRLRMSMPPDTPTAQQARAFYNDAQDRYHWILHNVPAAISPADMVDIVEEEMRDTPQPMPGLDPSVEEAPRTLAQDLTQVINRHSAENGRDTPDWILGNFLLGCLESFNVASRARDKWWQFKPRNGMLSTVLEAGPTSPAESPEDQTNKPLSDPEDDSRWLLDLASSADGRAVSLDGAAYLRLLLLSDPGHPHIPIYENAEEVNVSMRVPSDAVLRRVRLAWGRQRPTGIEIDGIDGTNDVEFLTWCRLIGEVSKEDVRVPVNRAVRLVRLARDEAHWLSHHNPVFLDSVWSMFQQKWRRLVDDACINVKGV